MVNKDAVFMILHCWGYKEAFCVIGMFDVLVLLVVVHPNDTALKTMTTSISSALQIS